MLGRGDGDAHRRRELHPLQIARPVGQPDREVEIGLGEIGVFVRREDIMHPRRGRLEPGEARREPLGVEFARDGDGVAVRGLSGLHRLDAFLEPQEAFAQGIEPGLALGREFEPLGGAAEKDDAEHILQCADLLAHRGRRHRQLVRRAGEGEMPRRCVEHAQGIEREMSALHAA